MEPADYWLSTELSDAIDAWYLFWENHFDFERGWDDPQSRAQWAQTGERVLAGLRREVRRQSTVSGVVAWRTMNEFACTMNEFACTINVFGSTMDEFGSTINARVGSAMVFEESGE